MQTKYETNFDYGDSKDDRERVKDYGCLTEGKNFLIKAIKRTWV